jgi:hypothetical protein
MPNSELLTNRLVQTARSKVLLYPYYAILFGGFFSKSKYSATSYSVLSECPNLVCRLHVYDEPYGCGPQDLVWQELRKDCTIRGDGEGISWLTASGG